MAEVKTGLEVTLGFLDASGTQGKVYYNTLTGSLGTRNLGIGTSDNTGTRVVYYGSGLAVCSGVAKVVAQGTGTMAASAHSGSFTTYNLEVGSDTTFDITAGAEATTRAGAVTARAATQSGHVQLGYVTVTNPGSVISGSIIEERTFGDPAEIGYVTGVNYEFSNSPIQIYDGPTYSHAKPQRPRGKATYKVSFVEDGSANPWPTSSTYQTQPRGILELDYAGFVGTTEEVHLLLDAVKDNISYDIPEEEAAGAEVSAFFASRLRYA